MRSRPGISILSRRRLAAVLAESWKAVQADCTYVPEDATPDFALLVEALRYRMPSPLSGMAGIAIDGRERPLRVATRHPP
jgi:hypothetical protein